MAAVTRRFFATAILSTTLFVACSRKDPVKVVVGGPKKVDWRERVIGKIQHQHVESPIEFDPVLAGLLVSFLFGVLKQCLLQNVLAQHRAVNRRPNGAVAQKMRQKLSAGFSQSHPDADHVAVIAHCESAMKSFREATTEEIVRLYQEQQTTPANLDEVDWNAAVVRSILNDVTE